MAPKVPGPGAMADAAAGKLAGAADAVAAGATDAVAGELAGAANAAAAGATDAAKNATGGLTNRMSSAITPPAITTASAFPPPPAITTASAITPASAFTPNQITPPPPNAAGEKMGGGGPKKNTRKHSNYMRMYTRRLKSPEEYKKEYVRAKHQINKTHRRIMKTLKNITGGMGVSL